MKHSVSFTRIAVLLLAVALHGANAAQANSRNVTVGVEVFSIDPSIVTPEEKKEEEKKPEEAKQPEPKKKKNGFMGGFGKGIGSGVAKNLGGLGRKLNLPSSGDRQVDQAARNTVAQSVIQQPVDPKLAEVEQEKIAVPPKTASLALRKTEAYYLAVRLAKLLERAEPVNMVAVIPAAADANSSPQVSTPAFDYVLRVTLNHSDGNEIGVDGQLFSSVDGFSDPINLSGRGGRTSVAVEAYEGEKDPNTGDIILEKDPYDPAMERVVDAFVSEYEKADKKILNNKKHSADLSEFTFVRYGYEMAPDVFGSYPIRKKWGGYAIETKPSSANPYVAKVAQVHTTELTAHKQFTEHYYRSADGAELQYNLWRKNTQEALIEYEALKTASNAVRMSIIGNKVGERAGETIGRALGGLFNGQSPSESVDLETEEDRLKAEFAQMLVDSMIERDGYVTKLSFPSWVNVAEAQGYHEAAERLRDYGAQSSIQAQTVASLQGEFTTLSAPTTLELLTRTETYDGKVDVALAKFREDLRSEFKSELGLEAN